MSPQLRILGFGGRSSFCISPLFPCLLPSRSTSRVTWARNRRSHSLIFPRFSPISAHPTHSILFHLFSFYSVPSHPSHSIPSYCIWSYSFSFYHIPSILTQPIPPHPISIHPILSLDIDHTLCWGNTVCIAHISTASASIGQGSHQADEFNVCWEAGWHHLMPNSRLLHLCLLGLDVFLLEFSQPLPRA